MRTSRVVRGIKLGFEWHGGTYIDVCQGEAYSHPKEVINVEDAKGNRPDFTMDNFKSEVDEWIESYGPKDLAHDVRENWGYY
jgi:hypothetical protein